MIISPGEGKSVNIIGNSITIRLRGRDTGGVLSMTEPLDQSGGGPPSHIHHREDETVQVIEGEYEFTCGEKKFAASKGATIFAPRDVPHSYRCVSRMPGRLLVTHTPAGLEEFFEEVGGADFAAAGDSTRGRDRKEIRPGVLATEQPVSRCYSGYAHLESRIYA